MKYLKEKIPLIILQSAIIIISAAALGFLVNQLRSDGLSVMGDWSPQARVTTSSGESMVVSLEEAREMCSNKEAVFLDARSPKDYARGHIRCAQNIPWQYFDEYMERVFEIIPDDTWIVTYCDGETCSLSEDLARELVSMGYQKVKVLLSGWTRWLEAGLPTERG